MHQTKRSSRRCFFFFQAEDGIRDKLVTGVQTCALPICPGPGSARPDQLARPDRGVLPLGSHMPWRHDFVQCFWVDPDWGGFSGYPGDEAPPRRPPEPSGPAHVHGQPVPHWAKPDTTDRPIGAAVVVVRDRTGFSYERHVGLDDFVTVRDAAQLLGVPAMTV